MYFVLQENNMVIHFINHDTYTYQRNILYKTVVCCSDDSIGQAESVICVIQDGGEGGPVTCMCRLDDQLFIRASSKSDSVPTSNVWG